MLLIIAKIPHWCGNKERGNYAGYALCRRERPDRAHHNEWEIVKKPEMPAAAFKKAV